MSVEDYGSSDEEPVEGSESEEGSPEPLTLRIVDASSKEAPDEELALRKAAIKSLVEMHYHLNPKITSAVQHANRTWVSGTHDKSSRPLVPEDNTRPFMVTFDEPTIQNMMGRLRPNHVGGKRII